LPRERDHILKALHKLVFTGLSGTTIMGRIEGGEEFTVTIGLIAELDEKGG